MVGDICSLHLADAHGCAVGQAVRLFGNVTGALQFDVNVDGAVTRGRPVGQLLASVSGLEQGDHTVSLTVTEVGSGSNLLFESAVVTVGTGFTGYVCKACCWDFSRADTFPRNEEPT
jgi:hypothetical protein